MRMRIVSTSLLKPPRSEGEGQGNSVPLWGLGQSPNRPSAQYVMNHIYDAHAHRPTSFLKPPRSEGEGQGNSVPLWGLGRSSNRPSAQYVMNHIYDVHAHRFIKFLKAAAKRRGRSRELSSLVGFGAKPQSSFCSVYHIHGQLTKPAAAGTMKLTEKFQI